MGSTLMNQLRFQHFRIYFISFPAWKHFLSLFSFSPSMHNVARILLKSPYVVFLNNRNNNLYSKFIGRDQLLSNILQTLQMKN